jgi:uncharacterized protein (TIGR02145 family)
MNRSNQLLILFVAVASSLFTQNCKKENAGTITDIDGNVYHIVTIGRQVWMAENLRVTRYRNGDLIPNVSDTAQWCYLPIGTHCNYDNTTKNGNIYGCLYNWYAVTDVRNIAPKGWHVPNFEEMETLVAYLGGDTIAAGKMKEAGMNHWLNPNTRGPGNSGFLALPGGYRHYNDATFHTMNSNGYWWTTTRSFEMYAWSKRFYSYFANPINVNEFKTLGLSVRCVKD